MKLHHKGYILTILEQSNNSWDDALIKAALSEYALSGDYWINHFSIILDELASAGLISRDDYRLDNERKRLSFNYSMSDFGRARMRDTGLL
jgi:hypothetical protein